jgi:caffeoyl-CoA O-methyltransferase
MADKGIPMTEELRQYLVAHSIPRTDAERELVAVTREAMGDLSGMQIAEEQGPFLTLLARTVGTQLAVEVGTFTGLSAMCIAEGLSDGGRLHCFDISDEYVSVGRPYWERAGLADRIEVHIGAAADTLGAFHPDGPVDFAFIDADKPGYATYYERILELLRPGGMIVVDNTLWSGAVVDPTVDDGNTRAIRALNDLVAADDRVDATLVNIGDGLMLARKR